MTAQELVNKYNWEGIKSFLQDGLTAKSKGDYLNWVIKWKTNYAELSRDIRSMKGMRKTKMYTYRDKGDDTSQKRVVVGENPTHDSTAYYQVDYLIDIANAFLRARQAAKDASWERKLSVDTELVAA